MGYHRANGSKRNLRLTHSEVQLSPCSVWVLKYREAQLWTTEKVCEYNESSIPVVHCGTLRPCSICSHFVVKWIDWRMLPQRIIHTVLSSSLSVYFVSVSLPGQFLSPIELNLTLTSQPQHQFLPLPLSELQNEVRPQHSGRRHWTQFGVGHWKLRMVRWFVSDSCCWLTICKWG